MAYPGIGEDKTDGVVYLPCLHFVGGKEQGRNGQPCGIGAGALLSSARDVIRQVHVPYRKTPAVKGLVDDVCTPHFIQGPCRGIPYKEMAIAVIDALVSCFPFQGARRRYRHLHLIAIRSVEITGGGECPEGGGLIGHEHIDGKINLHVSGAPSAHTLEPAYHCGRLGVERRGRDVLIPGSALLRIKNLLTIDNSDCTKHCKCPSFHGSLRRKSEHSKISYHTAAIMCQAGRFYL